MIDLGTSTVMASANNREDQHVAHLHVHEAMVLLWVTCKIKCLLIALSFCAHPTSSRTHAGTMDLLTALL